MEKHDPSRDIISLCTKHMLNKIKTNEFHDEVITKYSNLKHDPNVDEKEKNQTRDYLFVYLFRSARTKNMSKTIYYFFNDLDLEKDKYIIRKKVMEPLLRLLNELYKDAGWSRIKDFFPFLYRMVEKIVNTNKVNDETAWKGLVFLLNLGMHKKVYSLLKKFDNVILYNNFLIYLKNNARDSKKLRELMDEIKKENILYPRENNHKKFMEKVVYILENLRREREDYSDLPLFSHLKNKTPSNNRESKNKENKISGPGGI